ncbi:hypothetical protein ID866_4868 [Astraeus odoratus]|nr:hypothetical protein ID866_4868 [Astraeus odoratus]
MNVDGALRDDAVFVLGDDGDDDDIDLQQISSRIHAVSRETGLSTAYTSSPEPKLDHLPDSFAITKSEDPVSDRGIDLTTTDEAAPRVYHLRRGDTLQGIALRCGVNGYELCRLNNLPPSTLSTTPHLLHTRTTIKLPPSARPSFGRATPPVDPEADIRRVRGRAEERLQILTKETDWRVAKAYVALADDPEEEVVHAMKCKEMRVGVDGVTLDARAVSMYLDDEEWEEEQRKVGKVFTPSRTTTFRACK